VGKHSLLLLQPEIVQPLLFFIFFSVSVYVYLPEQHIESGAKVASILLVALILGL